MVTSYKDYLPIPVTGATKTNKDIGASRIERKSGSSGKYFKVYSTFFGEYYNKGQLMEGCVVMFGSCHSYGDTGNTSSALLDAVVNCGAAAAIGYENPVYQLLIIWFRKK
ncbi:MAG: hypothetical protein K6G47_02430 [Clostridia bacterium]|nr:hypothetical protein [Clostridia bacterium]